jgi:XTP/dITP diphosphohydrolase
MKLLIATNNKGKMREIRQILAGLNMTAVSLAEAGVSGDPVEDADTFEGNAIKKAQYFANATSLPTIADDSGLCVDALDGAPGVYSARYAGPDATDADNIKLMLKNLANVPDEKRTAHFACAMVCVRADGKVLATQGRANGTILRKPRGENGFGYDPIFYVEKFDKTFAQLPAETKHSISHRGKALRKLVEGLAGFLE